jgi:hypothetical protein
MLLGVPVSPGFVDKASARLSDRLEDAGFDEAMLAALAAGPALGADETPVNVLTPQADPDTGEPETGAPHVLVIRPPGGRLTWLRAAAARSPNGDRAACSPGPQTSPRSSARHTAWRRRPRPGTALWTRSCWRSCASATTRPPPSGSPTTGTGTGTTPNHPGYVLGCWLRDYAGQVWLFTREPAVDWTNNVCEQGAKAAKRHQAVSGYWHTQATLARWCRIRSYLDPAAACGLTALDAVTAALAGRPWLPAAVPAAA